jgi:hypothetical protein
VLVIGAFAAPFAGARAASTGAASTGVAGSNLTALASGVRYQLNSPGFLPVGDPAEGNIMEFDLPFARVGASQGPLINAVGSPLYPGDTAAHLGTAIATFSPQAPKIENYPILAESNYPPTPSHGGDVHFGQNGVGEARSQTSASGASVVATELAQSIGGVVDVASSTVYNDVKIAADKVTSQARSVVGGITIAGLITINGVTGTAEAVSDGANAKPAGHLDIGRVTVAGQAAYIDSSGVHVVGAGGGDGIVAPIQTLLDATLAQDGISIRSIAPVVTHDGGQASASAGALAITLERTAPAVSVPGLPALSIPGVATVALGTPDLPMHIEMRIGDARAAANATAVPSFDTGGEGVGGSTGGGGLAVDATTFDSGASVTGPGASVEGALTGGGGGPVDSGGAALALQPTADASSSRGIPVGWVIVGFLGAIVVSGPLLGYARWQLLEGRRS